MADFETSIDAWERYLKQTDGKPDADVATLVFRAYSSIAFSSTNTAVVERRLKGAQTAAAAVAEGRPGPNSYFDLAAAAYLAGDEKAAEKAADQALAEVDDSGRSALKTQLEQVKRQGKLVRQQIKAQENASPEDLEDPLGDLGGTGSAVPGDPAAPPAGG